MKQTKKKVISLLLGLLCIFSLTACGSTKESTKNADVQSQAEQNAVGLAQTIVELSDSDIENYMISGDEFTENAMAAWDGAREELGALVEIKDSDLSTEYDETSKVYTVTVPAEFENADSNFVFEFDRTGSPSTLSVEVEYPKSVALQQAAMNTIMGLVVVFAVLIFLSFVISLLKYVPGFVESFGKKKKGQTEEPEQLSAAVSSSASQVSQEEESEEVTADEELIAVIAAAIAAAEGTSQDGFQVRSVRRIKRKKW